MPELNIVCSDDDFEGRGKNRNEREKRRGKMGKNGQKASVRGPPALASKWGKGTPFIRLHSFFVFCFLLGELLFLGLFGGATKSGEHRSRENVCHCILQPGAHKSLLWNRRPRQQQHLSLSPTRACSGARTRAHKHAED